MPIKVQESCRTANKQGQKRNSPQHKVIKTLIGQNKESMLKAARDKEQVIYKGRPTRITPGFSMEFLRVKKMWTDDLQFLRDHRKQPRLLYEVKV